VRDQRWAARRLGGQAQLLAAASHRLQQALDVEVERVEVDQRGR
jgi:hypothetical protein